MQGIVLGMQLLVVAVQLHVQLLQLHVARQEGMQVAPSKRRVACS